MVWFVNKTECKEVQRIQKKATAWILSSWENQWFGLLANQASMVWFVNKTECKELERIQKKATATILSSWVTSVP